MDEADVKNNQTAISVFRSACGCLGDAPVTVVASTRAQVWCVSPTEAIPATLCLYECAAATWFAGWACSANSVDLQHYANLLEHLGGSLNNLNSPMMGSNSSAISRSAPPSITAQNEDTVSALISHVPVCWIRSAFHSHPPAAPAKRKTNETRVDAVLYTVGSSKTNAAAMVPRIVVLSSISSQFAQCLANSVAEHGGRCGSLPDASVFESLSSLRGEVVARSVQLPFFTTSPDAGIDRITAQLPVLAETLALFEGSLYKPCVVIYHSAAMWTTADQPPSDFMSSLGAQCVTCTQSSIFCLALPAHLPSENEDVSIRAQLDTHFCGGARLRYYDLETISLCDDGRTALLVSRNGCSSTHRDGNNAILASPSVVVRVVFPTREARAVFVSACVNQCESIKHTVIVCEANANYDRIPKTILDLNLNAAESEVIDVGSAVAVADTEYCTSIECSTRPMWPVTFPVFADGYELTEFWKLLSLHTATMLVKLSRVIPKSAHSSLALRMTNCITDIVGDRWGRAFLAQRAATVVVNCTSDPDRRREDASLSLQVLRFLLVECSVFIARATSDATLVVEAKDRIQNLLRDVEAVTCSKPANTTDRNVPIASWHRMQEQMLLVMIEGAISLGSDSDLTLSIVAPFATQYGGDESSSGANASAAHAHGDFGTLQHRRNNMMSPSKIPGGDFPPGGAPLADLSKMDVFMSTALSSFPSSLFCATHPLPALWRLVRPFLLPVLRSFFTRESFDSMFPTTSAELLSPARVKKANTVGVTSIGILTEDQECQTVETPLWKLLKSSSEAEIESATAGQIYLNRLFGKAAASIHGEDLSRPSAPVVEDWLYLASMVKAQDPNSSVLQQRIGTGQYGLGTNNYLNQTPATSSIAGGGGSGGGGSVNNMNMNMNNNSGPPSIAGGGVDSSVIRTPAGTPPIGTPIQARLATPTSSNLSSHPNSATQQQQHHDPSVSSSQRGAGMSGLNTPRESTPTASSSAAAAAASSHPPGKMSSYAQQQNQQQNQHQHTFTGGGNAAALLERRDMKINELEMREQSLQATISALHDELGTVRGEMTQLLVERRQYRSALLRERCDFLLEKEVSERRLLQGQEEVDRCGLHNFLIDRAIQESVSLLGDAAYQNQGGGGRLVIAGGDRAGGVPQVPYYF